ncbi:imidazoleglycerol-phosphate dehydratase [Desulfovibrio sp. OttesenSCG-928-M14]|nr:imidazoleglycerol-phosphate dehydratase [Desulfovibrio sp. OttesenSCG-928-M14]MDL2290849.1 imidazoleglycerol-phosphate dehydratase [Desulfovibrio sp. OttesenSCG-928-F20]
MQEQKRSAQITRTTKETDIALTLLLDGSGKVRVDTRFGMADHMITLLAFWAGFDLDLACKGDLHVDAHHTVEDVALCLGQALDKALGSRKGIARTAFARVPMDEALADVCVDLSGRSHLVFRGQKLLPPVMAGEESDLWREFFKSLANGAKMNLHITLEYGINGHHLLESACKGLGLALKGACTRQGDAILSTKGSLDL